MLESLIQNGQKILFIGDSITDCGRRGDAAPLGSGYVKLFSELMTVHHPDRQIDIINKGIGGNRVTDLDGRWEDDVVRHAPEWLSLKIGINDLHSSLRGSDDAVTPERFEGLFRGIIERSAAAFDPQILLIDPFYISTDESDSPRKEVLSMLPGYIEVVAKLAEEFATKRVKTHDIFQEHLKYRDPDTFCPEPVHPGHQGHLVIAQAAFDTLSA